MADTGLAAYRAAWPASARGRRGGAPPTLAAASCASYWLWRPGTGWRCSRGRPGSVALAGASEHDLVPGRDRGALAPSGLPARASRWLVSSLGLCLDVV